MKSSGTPDQTNFVTLVPVITRAYWGQRRAWNGQKVDMVIETRWVPDGTPVEIVIVGPGDILIEELPKGTVVKKGRVVVKHAVAWKHTHVTGLSPADEPDFQFIANLPSFNIMARSTPLYVDLGAYAVSS